MENGIYKVMKGIALTSISAFVCVMNSLSSTDSGKEATVPVKGQSVLLESTSETIQSTRFAPMHSDILLCNAESKAIPRSRMIVQGKNVQTEAVSSSWQEFHSVGGKCKMSFPKNPDHLSEKMRLPEEGFDLKYDAYISAIDQKTVYMLLIAQYPEFVDETYARMSLEGFLNGILTHNPNNQLIFADLSLVEGHEALDFFIRTGGVYFKGRALMVKNSLYLMAMECEVQNYDEGSYNMFVNSFKLSK